jgi:methyl-accepting chemotaxis protein
MQNIGPEELERKIQQVLEQKKEELYREFRDRMGLAVIEDRNTELLERMVRIEEEIKSHRIITENLIHQVDRRFEQVDKRFEQVDKRFEQVDKRFEQVDKRFEQVDKRFEQINKRFEQVDKRFEQVDRRFEQVNKRFDAVDRRFTSLQWLIGIGFVVLSALMSMYQVL